MTDGALGERSPLRDAAIRAMLPIAAREGWTWSTIRAGLAAAGEDPALAQSHFPTGPVGAVLAWIDLANREMEAAAAAEEVTALRVPARIRRVVELRLQAVAPHKEALRRALALLALPWNAPAGLRASACTVNAMWHAAGDTSSDFSWYTRRATLAAIYWATLAFWMQDEEPGLDRTMAFLDRRLADLGRLQRRRLRRPGRPAAA
jgi:ubiquinone biosynthesis protein COQ9